MDANPSDEKSDERGNPNVDQTLNYKKQYYTELLLETGITQFCYCIVYVSFLLDLRQCVRLHCVIGSLSQSPFKTGHDTGVYYRVSLVNKSTLQNRVLLLWHKLVCSCVNVQYCARGRIFIVKKHIYKEEIF